MVKIRLTRAGSKKRPFYRVTAIDERKPRDGRPLAGGGVGLAVRGRFWWCGTAALRLKRRIDRRWLARYRTPAG